MSTANTRPNFIAHVLDDPNFTSRGLIMTLAGLAGAITSGAGALEWFVNKPPVPIGKIDQTGRPSPKRRINSQPNPFWMIIPLEVSIRGIVLNPCASRMDVETPPTGAAAVRPHTNFLHDAVD